MKKRRSRINREEYDNLFPVDIEEIVKDYNLKELEKIISNVFDFYLTNIVRFSPSLDEFRAIFLSYTRGYIKEREISFYYYIKYSLEVHYKMYNHKKYFNEMIEAAFVKYLTVDDNKIREYIYKRFLNGAFSKLIENIINTYKLRSHTLSYEDQHTTTLALIHEKIKNFKPNRNKKAYSYFGTVIKNHWIAVRKEEKKVMAKIDSYDVYKGHILENLQYSYLEKDSEENWNVDFFYKLKDIINDYIDTENKHDFFSKKDLIVGNAIIEIIENWEKIFSELEVNGKTTNTFQKKYVFHVLRNYTGLTTAEISKSLKIFKEAYKKWKNDYVTKKYNPFDDFN